MKVRGKGYPTKLRRYEAKVWRYEATNAWRYEAKVRSYEAKVQRKEAIIPRQEFLGILASFLRTFASFLRTFASYHRYFVPLPRIFVLLPLTFLTSFLCLVPFHCNLQACKHSPSFIWQIWWKPSKSLRTSCHISVEAPSADCTGESPSVQPLGWSMVPKLRQ